MNGARSVLVGDFVKARWSVAASREVKRTLVNSD